MHALPRVQVSRFVSMVVLAALASCGGSGGGSGSGGSIPAPAVDFSATPTLGPRPLDVQFTNTTTGTVTTWLWEFGDGTTSNDIAPLHPFAGPGSFAVKLTATGPGGIDSLSKPDFVRVTAPLVDAGFESQSAGTAPGAPWEVFYGPLGNFGHVINSAAGGMDAGMPTEGQLWCELGADSTDAVLPPAAGSGATARTGAGIAQEFTFPSGQSVLQLDVLFVNAEGPNQPQQNDWMQVDVSDGATSITLASRDTFSPIAGLSPLHGGSRTTALETITADLAQLFPGSTFTTPFTLTVQIGNGGNGTRISKGYVDRLRFEAPAPPLGVAFNGNPAQIVAGQQVAFADHTPGGPTAWVWDFGDGKGSNAQNALHVYGQPGVYDVVLHATAPGTQGELRKVGYITVLSPMGNVDFVGQPTPLAIGQPVQFTNISNGNFSGAWTWEFGDGQVSNASGFGAPVVHTYASAAHYSVRLTGILTNGAPATLLKPNYIDVQTPVSISSHPVDTTVSQGQAANFTVLAHGTAPLHYVWLRNGAAITGAPDQPDYSTPPATPADNGAKFSVRVRNDVSSLTSNQATLTVIVAPVITAHPQSITVPVGTPAMFNVSATGTAPLHYTWRKNGAAITGAPDQPSYTTPPTTPANSGDVYSVRVSNAAGFADSQGATLTVQNGPVVAFTGSPLAGAKPLNVAFTNQTTGVTTGWLWNFGDPSSGAANTSTLSNPSHSYASAGSYTVKLTAQWAGNPVSLSKPNYVTVSDPPAIDFSGTPVSGTTPLSVSFHATNTGGPVQSWSWDFGDGATSQLQNPIHIYTLAPSVGTKKFTVKLFAVGAGGTQDTETKVNYITANNPPVVTIVASPSGGAVPLTVNFTVTSSGGPITNYAWDFGDPTSGGLNTSSLAAPQHKFDSAGNYTVQLTATGPGGQGFDPQLINVTTPAAPVANFNVSATTFDANTPITFTNTTTGAVTSWQWEFGDGATSSQQTPPAKVYKPSNAQITPGASSKQYTIKLTAFGPGGQSSKSTLVTVNVLRFTTIYSTFTSITPPGVNACSLCHNGASPSGGLDLSPEATAFTALTIDIPASNACASGSPRVIAYHSSTSVLYKKLDGSPCAGANMNLVPLPPTAPPYGYVTSQQLADIKRWIETGALP